MRLGRVGTNRNQGADRNAADDLDRTPTGPRGPDTPNEGAGFFPISSAGAPWRLILIGAAAVALALAALYRFPPHALPCGPFDPQREGARVPSLLAQLHDPVHWDHNFEYAWAQRSLTHALAWRLVIPVVCHDLGLTDLEYLWVPWIGALALLGAVAWYAWQATREIERVVLVLAFFVTASAWSSSVGVLGCMDSWYLLALLGFCFSRSPVVGLMACLCGPWIDERFLLALPLCAALRCEEKRWWLPVLGILPYLAIRLAAVAAGDDSVGGHLQLVSAPLGRFALWLPIGWWHGWRAGWVVVAAGLVLFWWPRRTTQVWLLAAGMLGLAATGLLAWDSSRSIAVLLPWLIVGASRYRGPSWPLWLLAAVNFIVPAAFVTAVWSGTAGFVPAALPM